MRSRRFSYFFMEAAETKFKNPASYSSKALLVENMNPGKGCKIDTALNGWCIGG